VDLEQEPFPIANFTLTPRLSGTVKRPPVFPETEPQPVPGAAVWVEPSGGGSAIATTVSDCAGNFSLPVAAGTYDVKADHPNDSIATKFINGVSVTSGAACVSFIFDPDPLVQPGFCQ